MIAILIAAGLICAACAQPDQTSERVSHVRSSDAHTIALINRGYRESETFRSLVDVLDVSKVLVYIEPLIRLPAGREGELIHTVFGTADVPMLRVHVKVGLGNVYKIGVIAHELQHVKEAVDGGALKNGATMTMLFARLDRTQTRGGDPFETEAARNVQARVLRELRISRRK